MSILSNRQLFNILRFCWRARINQVERLRKETHSRLKKSPVANRDLTKVVLPAELKAGDEASVESAVAWVRRVRKQDKPSMDQVVVIDATATARVCGG